MKNPGNGKSKSH